MPPPAAHPRSLVEVADWPGRLAYEVVDVFTDRPFAGNPLAVVYGAAGLETDQLQAVAREFNLSETAFPAPPTEEEARAGADYRVRIFTPDGEVPFAGHPTLGTAWALCRSGLLAPGARVQACGAGPIQVSVPSDVLGAVELSAPPRDPARPLAPGEAAALAALVGLQAADVDGEAYAAGCGLTWLYLSVRAEAVARARPSSRRVSEAGIDSRDLRDPVDGVVVYAADREGQRRSTPPADTADVEVRCRVFVPGYGIPEDPATGSAGVALGLVLVASGVARSDGETTYRITQGVEMRRPSVLRGRVSARGGAADLSRVAGQVVPVASGTVAVPAT